MPSRRRFLTAAGLVGTTGLSGCLTRLGVAETGFLSYKGVNVTWLSHGRPMSADLCWVWSDGNERIFGWVAEEYPTIVASPLDIHLSEETYGLLTDDFENVSVKLGFTRPENTDYELLEGDWYMASTSRRHFNRVQFGDRAEIVFRFPRVHLIDVYDGAQGDPNRWESELNTMDFSEMYRDRGVPIASRDASHGDP